MKRLILLTGLSCPLLFGAFPASAAGGDQYADLDPISSYVRAVIDRAKDGLNAAGGGGGGANEVLKAFWLDKATASALARIDTHLRIVEQEKSLLEVSPCLHIDTLILEGWIERVRQAKENAGRDGDAVKVINLLSLEEYLDRRMAALFAGVRDPSYHDTDEGDIYGFDVPPLWCCKGRSESEDRGAECASIGDEAGATNCTAKGGVLTKRFAACIAAGCAGGGREGDQEALCPFDSDYLPPVATGYGCDASVLEPYRNRGNEATKKEYEALEQLVRSRDEFIASVGPLKDIMELLNRYLDTPGHDLTNFQGSLSSNRSHRKVSGCLTEEQIPPELVLWDRRGSFSLLKNETVLMPALSALWRHWGRERLPPDYLKPSGQLAAGSEEQQKAKELENSTFAWFFLIGRRNSQQYLEARSVTQAEAESFVIAKALDASLQILEVLKPLRKEVSTFSLTVEKPDQGIRGFVRNFASFLRVSCLYRPCNERLDRILKIVFQDSCFPYANGLFLTDPKIHEKCQQEAGL